MKINMTLLVVDDEEELRENIVYDLSSSVSHILEAQNGAEALKMVKENQIDCVLTDINMPQKNGIEFARGAREWGYAYPIIFLTAHGDDELRKQALNVDAFDFIDKPYEVESLVEILAEASEEHQKIKNNLISDDSIKSEFKKSYLKIIKK